MSRSDERPGKHSEAPDRWDLPRVLIALTPLILVLVFPLLLTLPPAADMGGSIMLRFAAGLFGLATGLGLLFKRGLAPGAPGTLLSLGYLVGGTVSLINGLLLHSGRLGLTAQPPLGTETVLVGGGVLAIWLSAPFFLLGTWPQASLADAFDPRHGTVAGGGAVGMGAAAGVLSFVLPVPLLVPDTTLALLAVGTLGVLALGVALFGALRPRMALVDMWVGWSICLSLVALLAMLLAPSSSARLFEVGNALLLLAYGLPLVLPERRPDMAIDELAPGGRVLRAVHELRAPLTPMRLELSTLETALRADDDRADASVMATERLGRSLDRLEQRIEDLLDAARAEGGRLRLETRTTDLARCIQEEVDRWEPVAAEQEVTLWSDLPVECTTRVDPARFVQVLENLIVNALRFTPPGGRITVQLLDDVDQVEILVQDTGIGIDPDRLEDLFHPFTSAHADTDLPPDSLGLGLHLCQAIIRGHGGTITASSDGPGTGATFRVVLPRL